MATDRSTTSIAATYAMLIAGALIATQVAGKATRDAFYLSNHDVSTLPVMLISAAVASILAVFLWARAMTRWGPRRLMTAAFLGSAALLFAEWGMAGVAPGMASILVYFHMAALGALLVSGFWSLVNERFDPRTAKKQMGRIAGGATLGGLLGGLLAERVGATMSVSTMLPIMGVLHLGCALAGRRLEASAGGGTGLATGPGPEPGATGMEPDPEDATRVAFTTLARVPYLRNLALLVVTMMAAAALIDYVFKVEATRAYTGGENLMRFFAIFYTAVATITFVVQSTLSQRLLERLGLAQTVGTSPLIIAIGSVAAMVFPGLPTAAALRGTESTLQSSLYRSGYELLFTPIAPREKRATKSIIDVGFSRLGDVVGGGIVQLVLIFLPLVISPTLLGLTIALSVVALLITRRLHRGYVRSLERSLKAQAVALDLDEVSDRTTRDTLIQSMTHLDLSQIQATAMLERPEVQVSPAGDAGGKVATPARTGTPTRPAAPPPVPHDPLVRQVAELRSGDPIRVVRALQETDLPVELAGHVIPLLAWDVVSRDAVKALRKIAPRIRGQLGDSLGDPRQEFAIRRRIPRVLAADPGQATAEVLMTALRDRRFEVRYRCGQALARVVSADPKVDIAPERVYDAVLTETEVERRVWESRRLLDETDREDLPPLLDEALEYRTNRSLEHVFTLLSIALPPEPLRIAYRGLLTNDQKLRGTSLEYLESVLPSRVRTILWPYLEGERAVSQAAGQPREEVLQKLMQSSESIVANLEELRRRTGEDIP